MKKIEIAQTVGVLANLGVIAGLVFLIIELQQANRIAFASMEIEVRNNISSINESFYESSDISELMVKTMDPNATLNEVEAFRIGSVVRRLMNAWLAIETAYDNGLVPESTFNVIRDDIRASLSTRPAARPVWREIADSYPAQHSTQTYQWIYEQLEEFSE